MDRAEARAILRDRISVLRRLSYDELKTRYLSDVEDVTILGDNGVAYQVEVQALWDDRRRRHIRVLVGIDDGGLRAFMPLTDSFIVAPDGTFIGE